MSVKRVIDRFKTAVGQDYLPQNLVSLLRRVLGLKYQEYDHAFDSSEPHRFTFPANNRFSVSAQGLKMLIKNGLTKVQCDETSKITLYFEGAEQALGEGQGLSPGQLQAKFEELGKKAFEGGLKMSPMKDPAFVKAFKELDRGGPKPI